MSQTAIDLISDADLLELERLDTEASPAPWATSEDEDNFENKVVAIDPSDEWLILATLLRMDGLDTESEALDAELIVKMRNGARGLISRLRTAERKVSAAKEVIDARQEDARIEANQAREDSKEYNQANARYMELALVALALNEA